MVKKICVVTGTRAEYSLLRPLISHINDDKELELQLVVTGMHLSPEFGLTYKEIENDGFLIHDKVETLLSSDTPAGISKSIGLGMIGFADVFERIKPNMVIVLGDRYETFAVVSSALAHGIPIAHLHGGEVGAGTIDNMLRHAITKMSSLHFTSTEQYRKRVIQLGEEPNNVYNVGSLGVENIRDLKLYTKETIENQLNFNIDDNTILFTFHTLSLEYNVIRKQMGEILSAFDRISELKIIFTKSNSDTGGRIINEMIDNYVSLNPKKSIAFTSLGTIKYLSTAKYVKAVVGNSSSGIIEIPSLGTYTLNIGKRQDGRIQSESIYNCEATEQDVFDKLIYIITKPKLFKVVNPYEKENTSINIINTIKDRLQTDQIWDKKFYDINF